MLQADGVADLFPVSWTTNGWKILIYPLLAGRRIFHDEVAVQRAADCLHSAAGRTRYDRRGDCRVPRVLRVSARSMCFSSAKDGRSIIEADMKSFSLIWARRSGNWGRTAPVAPPPHTAGRVVLFSLTSSRARLGRRVRQSSVKALTNPWYR